MKLNTYKMSVDKFGSMGGESSTTIQPLRNYAINLDNLENVEGFNEEGKKDKLYCFQLNEKGVYIRIEVPSTGTPLDSSGWIENKPLTFVHHPDSKWIPLPLKYEWDIDIHLNSKEISTLGTDHSVLTIFNSGKIFGSFVPLTMQRSILLIRENTQYYLGCRATVGGYLYFQTEFEEDKKIINEPPTGSTLIIEGRIISESPVALEILPGLQIQYTYKPPREGLFPSLPFDFRIVIQKGEGIEYNLRDVTSGLQVTQQKDKAIKYDPIRIHKFYYISRIRLTTKPVTDQEILYL